MPQRLLFAPLIAVALAASMPAVAAEIPSAIAAAIADPHRTPENRVRDPYRHPAETLAFFGLKPGTTVVEISPQGHYFTQILRPAIGPGGRLYASVNVGSDAAKAAAAVAAERTKDGAMPGFAPVTVTSFGPTGMDIAPAGVADLVLTFRNVHNWMGGGYAPAMFQAFFRALKPGGTLGLEEHRLPEARTTDLDGSKGYVKQSVVIQMAEAAGFKLAATSEVNANPRDTADYPQGVWMLPPSYQEGDKDRARYAAIGESDRMTLKFVKP